MNKYTIKDVAKAAGVSTATVSRVLNGNGYVSEHARKLVMDNINKLKYRPNAIARSLKQDKSRIVGFVLPDLMNSYFIKMAKIIQQKLLIEGYHLLLVESEEDPSKEKEVLDVLLEKRVEAIILAGTGENRNLVQSIYSSGIYVILADRRIQGLSVDLVAEDNMQASYEAIAYLLEKQHQYIGIINGPVTVSTAKERYLGMKEAFSAKQIPIDGKYIYLGDYTRESGLKAIQYLMDLPIPPTAIFSANNEMTFGVYLGLKERGLPLDQLEIISFGDLEFSSLFNHRLSVIMQNPIEIGETIADMVIEGLERSTERFEERLFIPKLLKKANI